MSTQELPHETVPPSQPPPPVPHFPWEHVSLPVHAFPQLPQLALSVFTSTQEPLHAVKPALHEPEHFPAEQTSVDAHFVPHAPQFAGSLVSVMQRPPHAVSLPVQLGPVDVAEVAHAATTPSAAKTVSAVTRALVMLQSLHSAVYPRGTMKPILYVGNRNYSSWSLRPWLVLEWAGIDHEVRVVPLGGEGYAKRAMPSVLAVSPSGTVPALHLPSGPEDVVTDSLAISEWAAEQAPEAGLWPAEPIARALARSATCEMHSGFGGLRGKLPCNIRRRAEPRTFGEDVLREIRRVEAIWSTLRRRFGAGGPYLFGMRRGIVDAFFTPVATRFRTYGVELADREAKAYAATLLDDPAFREWEAEANKEPWSMAQWDAA